MFGIPGTAPASYLAQTDNEESASAVITNTLYSRTADGEVPQQQAVIESRGGGDVGAAVINPGIEVTNVFSTTGDVITAGITGTDAI